MPGASTIAAKWYYNTTAAIRGTFSVGADALRCRKEATAALVAAQGRGESPAIIKTLEAAEERTEADLKRVTNWCAIAKFGLQTLEKKLDETMDEVAALDFEIDVLDCARDGAPVASTCMADLNAVMDFLG